MREEPIVGVEQYDEIAPACKNSGISGGRKALIILMNVSDRVGLGNLGSIVDRSVIDHDYFDVAVGLLKNCLYRFGQEIRLVIARYNDRDQRPLAQRWLLALLNGPFANRYILLYLSLVHGS